MRRLNVSPSGVGGYGATGLFVAGLLLLACEGPSEPIKQPPIVPPGRTASPLCDGRRGRWLTPDEAKGLALPSARSYFASAQVGDVVYSFGGHSPGPPPNEVNVGLMNEVLRLDLASPTGWTQLDPMPRRNAAHGAITVDGKVWIIGGFTRTAQPMQFDPLKQAWLSSTDDLALPTKAVMWGGFVPYKGKLLRVAGKIPNLANDGEYLARSDQYDPARNLWSTLPGNLPTPRYGACSLVGLDGKLRTIGGEYWDAQGHKNRDIMVYDDAGTWRKTGEIPSDPDPGVVGIPCATHPTLGGVLMFRGKLWRLVEGQTDSVVPIADVTFTGQNGDFDYPVLMALPAPDNAVLLIGGGGNAAGVKATNAYCLQ